MFAVGSVDMPKPVTEARVMLEIEGMLECLDDAAKKRVVDWVLSRWTGHVADSTEGIEAFVPTINGLSLNKEMPFDDVTQAVEFRRGIFATESGVEESAVKTGMGVTPGEALYWAEEASRLAGMIRVGNADAVREMLGSEEYRDNVIRLSGIGYGWEEPTVENAFDRIDSINSLGQNSDSGPDIELNEADLTILKTLDDSDKILAHTEMLPTLSKLFYDDSEESLLTQVFGVFDSIATMLEAPDPMLAARVVATSFIADVGASNVVSFLKKYSPDIVLANAPEDSPYATENGRAYVQDLWSELEKQVGLEYEARH